MGDEPLDSLLRRLALELPGLPLLELGRPLARGGGAPADSGGRLDVSFGQLQIHSSAGWVLLLASSLCGPVVVAMAPFAVFFLRQKDERGVRTDSISPV